MKTKIRKSRVIRKPRVTEAEKDLAKARMETEARLLLPFERAIQATWDAAPNPYLAWKHYHSYKTKKKRIAARAAWMAARDQYELIASRPKALEE